nr:diguanylate cyclase [Actinomycetota bacterium]
MHGEALLPKSKVVRGALAAIAALLALEAVSAIPGVVDPTTSLSIRATGGLLIILLGTSLCIARPIVRRHERAAWACIAGFLVCNTIGAAYFAIELAEVPERPSPSWSDVFWFMRYGFLYAGVHLLIRSRTPGFGAAQWVDGAVGACSLLAVSGMLVIDPVLNHVDDPTARTIFVAYPVANVIGLGFVVGVVGLMGLRLRNWAALSLALVLFVVADGLYVRVLAIHGSAPVGGPYDAGFLPGALFFALAAWQPTARERERVEEASRSVAAVLPLVFAALGLTLLSVNRLRDMNVFVWAGAASALGAVLVRQALYARDNRRILARVGQEAVTDSLTGLPNRRCLIQDLTRRIEEEAKDAHFAVALMDLDGFKGYNDAFGHHAGDELLSRLGGKLAQAVGRRGRAYRLGGDEFCVVTEPGEDHRDVISRAAAALSEAGAGFHITCSHGWVYVPSEAADVSEILRLADSRMYAHKGAGRRVREREETTAVLSAVVRERYPDLDGHTDGVAAWSLRVAERMGVPRSTLEEVRLGGVLHDVGKMAVPDSIVNKPGPLDDGEWDFMRRHTIVGARIIEAAPGLAHVAPVARWHHERWDGQGYPDGLAREDIPLSARIVAVCDAFQAMIDDRPYRSGRPTAEAVAELRRCAGTQFDPVVVDCFVTLLAEPPRPGRGAN